MAQEDPGAGYSFDAPRRSKLWSFLWLNLLGVGAMLALFFAVLYADGSTGFFASTWDWFSDHQVLMALAASTPFFAAMLVGRASSAKAKRKRLAEARRAAEADAAAARKRRGEAADAVSDAASE